MKIFNIFVSLIATVLIAIYVLLFTATGNSYIKPKLEQKIQSETGLDVKLEKFMVSSSKLDIALALDSANIIYIKGDYSLLDSTIDFDYNLKLVNLENLAKLVDAKICGSFKTTGKIKGSLDLINIDGTTDVASSNTAYHITLTKFNPTSIILNMQNLKIEDALVMVKQPHYADGLLNVNAKITDIRFHKLKGNIVTTISNGLVDKKFVSKEYGFKPMIPTTRFNAKTTTTLSGDLINTKVNLNSTLVALSVKNASFNLDNSIFQSDYVVDIAKLDRLFFVTGQHLRGGMKLDGEVKKSKDLDFTAHSVIAGGTLKAKLHNNDFKATLTSMKTLKVLNMLLYPEIFDATLNAKVDYDLQKAKGSFNGKLLDGKFTHNKVFDGVKRYAKLNLYNERFKGIIDADINKAKVLASLALKSNKTSIISKNAKINTKKQTIDAVVTLKTKKQPLSIKVSGKIASPDVKVDFKSLITKEIKQKVTKEITNLLHKFF